MEAVVAGLALIGVFIGSVLVGVYIVLHDASRWRAMAQWARRFIRSETLPPSESD
jgi:hypothetical protein